MDQQILNIYLVKLCASRATKRKLKKDNEEKMKPLLINKVVNKYLLPTYLYLFVEKVY